MQAIIEPNLKRKYNASDSTTRQDTDMTDNVETIREFIQAWSTLDAEKLAGYFTEDGTYHNIPAQPVSGRANVQKFIAGFLASWTETTWDIVNLCGSGDLVFAERLDRTTTTQEMSIFPVWVYSKCTTERSGCGATTSISAPT